VMHRALAQGWLRLFCIEAEGQVMAMLYCYRWRDRMCYFQGGFDPAQSKLRPGLILMGHAIEQAIVEGAGVYDMLRGQYDFKTQWARSTRQTGVFELPRRTLGATAWHLRTEVLPGWKRRLTGSPTATAPAAPSSATATATAEASED
jgi:CelD/BcsL family acetyltransferase involved in cellulose biosynthesis